jgi:hypothetical protein
MALRRAIVFAIFLCCASAGLLSGPVDENPAVPAPEPLSPESGAAAAELVDLLAITLGQCPPQWIRQNAATGQKIPGFEPAKPIHQGRSGAFNPDEEGQEHQHAILQLEMLIDATGNARFVQVLRSVPVNPGSALARISIATLRSARFKAALRDGLPVSSWWTSKVRYLPISSGRLGSILSDEKLQAYIVAARKGDFTSKAVVSYLYSVAESEVAIPQVEADRYLAEVALAGRHGAELQVAQRLSPASCIKPPRVQVLLREQASAGFPAAELLLGTELLETGDPASYHDIENLLHDAANSKIPVVQLWATGLLATSPVAEIRDPPFALQLAQDFKNSDDPDELEALAAAQAANAMYAEAIQTEERALKQARVWGWNDVLLSRRLTAYQSNQPWIGYLCDCTQLVPGEGL